jgi:spore maturation protein CgeB
MKIKKILYVGTEYEDFILKKDNSLNFKAWHNGFKNLGFNVQKQTFIANKDFPDQNKIIEKAEKFKPDIIFFVIQRDQVKEQTLKFLKKKYFIVNFFGDDYWRFDSFTSKYSKLFNVSITTDRFSISKYNLNGVKNVIFSQWASLKPKIVNSNYFSYDYDVSFIGVRTPYRSWLIDSLLKKGISVNCFGHKWKNGTISYLEAEKIIKTSKINLNIPNSISYDSRFFISNPKSLIGFIRNRIFNNPIKNNSGMKARIFEVTAYNGFLLTDYVPFIENYFNINNEIACYSNDTELENLIKYYLLNDKEREIKKANAYKNALKNHLYEHRIKKIINEIELLYYFQKGDKE